MSLPETRLGENNFTIINSYSYHLFGTVPLNYPRLYTTTRNCWSGYNDVPRIFLYNPLDTPVTPIGYIYIPTRCIPSSPSTQDITEQGFGLYDTTFISSYDSTDILPDDEALYSQAQQEKDEHDFATAITNYKALIDNFPSSSLIYTSLPDLYDCYVGLDTSSDQSIRDILYGNLKQYLNIKIASEDYPKEFEDEANLIVLMCETELENYNDALTGYEFISLYHPDAEQRLMASWEYDHIEDLLGGGGGEKDLGLEISDLGLETNVANAYIETRMARLNEFIDRDPIMKQLKERYERINKEKKALRLKEGYVSRVNVNEDKLIERSKQNIYTGKNMTKDQKEKRFLEDMNLLLNPDNLPVGNDNNKNLLPTEYTLSQNYPCLLQAGESIQSHD